MGNNIAPIGFASEQIDDRWRCPGCTSAKPTSQVGGSAYVLTDVRVGIDYEYGRVEQTFAIENINSTWNLQNKSGRNFGTLTLSNILIDIYDGRCKKVLMDCRPESPCKYKVRMDFELLSNTGTAGALLFRHEPRRLPNRGGTHTETRSRLHKPTFLPDALMWRYRYTLESLYPVDCDSVMEIKFDENSKFETEGLAINSGNGTKPVIIKLECSKCKDL